MDNLRFVDPPAEALAGVRKGPARRYATIVAQLVANPNAWAIVLEGSCNSVNVLKSRLLRGQGPWAGHRWEAVRWITADGTCQLYVRCVE